MLKSTKQALLVNADQSEKAGSSKSKNGRFSEEFLY